MLSNGEVVYLYTTPNDSQQLPACLNDSADRSNMLLNITSPRPAWGRQLVLLTRCPGNRCNIASKHHNFLSRCGECGKGGGHKEGDAHNWSHWDVCLVRHLSSAFKIGSMFWQPKMMSLQVVCRLAVTSSQSKHNLSLIHLFLQSVKLNLAFSYLSNWHNNILKASTCRLCFVESWEFLSLSKTVLKKQNKMISNDLW